MLAYMLTCAQYPLRQSDDDPVYYRFADVLTGTCHCQMTNSAVAAEVSFEKISWLWYTCNVKQFNSVENFQKVS